MRASVVIELALASSLPLAAGCTGFVSGPPSAGAAEPGSMTAAPLVGFQVRDPDRHLLYVADTMHNAVIIYREEGLHQKPIGKLTQDITFPNGLWVDTQRNLWVANTSPYGSTILRFPQGAIAPDLVLKDANWQAFYVWVNTKGDVFVVNCPTSGNCVVAVYPPGLQTPVTIGDPNLSDITAVVEDTKGDLFDAGIAITGHAQIDERQAGGQGWKNTGIPLYSPGALGFDARGNLVLSDTSTNVIETFPPGQTKASNTISCSLICISFAFNHRGDRIWIDEFNDGNGEIAELEYPSGKRIEGLHQPNGSSPQSVATGPDLYP